MRLPQRPAAHLVIMVETEELREHYLMFLGKVSHL